MPDVENRIDAARRKLEQKQAALAAQNGPPICVLSTEEIQSIVLTWFHDLEWCPTHTTTSSITESIWPYSTPKLNGGGQENPFRLSFR